MDHKEDVELEPLPEEYLDVLNAREFPVQEISESEQASSEAEPQEELTFEERLEKLRKTVVRQPPHREILYRTLAEACEMKTLPELEGFIAALPQFEGALQPQYYLIQFLVNAGGLAQYDVDADGNVIYEEEKEGLTEDEIDDLVATWAYEATDVGRTLVEQMRPSARIEALMEEHPGWDDALLSTLEYLSEKRSVPQLDSFLRGIPTPPSADTRFQPSAFVDRLERAGAIAWDKGWQCTEEGLQFALSRKQEAPHQA